MEVQLLFRAQSVQPTQLGIGQLLHLEKTMPTLAMEKDRQESTEMFFLPITADDVLKHAAVSHDFNNIHMVPTAAQAIIPDALSPIVHGTLIVGRLGAALTDRYGDGTVAGSIDKFKLSKPVFYNDEVGFSFEEQKVKVKGGRTFLPLRVEIWRRHLEEVAKVGWCRVLINPGSKYQAVVS